MNAMCVNFNIPIHICPIVNHQRIYLFIRSQKLCGRQSENESLTKSIQIMTCGVLYLRKVGFLMFHKNTRIDHIK